MKKIFFLAASAILLAAGCQKTEVINQVNPVDGTSINFTTNMGKLTKAAGAAGTGTENLSAQDFRLWAYYVAADPNRGASANAVYDGMDNITVSDNLYGEGWNTQAAHFWPGKGKKLKFFALSANGETYGAEHSNTPVNVVPSETGAVMTITDFTVSNTAPNTDLMVANYVESQQAADGAGSNDVNLVFKHALSKVEFIFKNTSEIPVIIQHMYVKGIKTVNTLTATGTSSDMNTTLSWGEATVANIFEAKYTKTAEDGNLPESLDTATNLTDFTNVDPANGTVVSIPDNGYMLLNAGGKTYATWLVLPQSIGTVEDNAVVAGTSLEISIVYIIGTRQFVAKFPLATTAVYAWAPNQYIKYNVNLTPNMIGFNPSVQEWETTPSNGVDINN